jgi:tetratricopeptide (TPR) repeat protein
MRWLTVVLAALASVATILGYLHLEPPWVTDHLPHLAWPKGSIVGDSAEPPNTAPNSSRLDYDAAFDAAKHATHRKDYAFAIAQYEGALSAPNLTAHRRALALDALGFTYFRAGEFDDADKSLNSALAIEPLNSARINLIKVMCGRGDAPGEIQSAMAALRADNATNARDAYETETDKELFKDCAYASVTSSRL